VIAATEALLIDARFSVKRSPARPAISVDVRGLRDLESVAIMAARVLKVGEVLCLLPSRSAFGVRRLSLYLSTRTPHRPTRSAACSSHLRTAYAAIEDREAPEPGVALPADC
jgi:hypothetical protein